VDHGVGDPRAEGATDLCDAVDVDDDDRDAVRRHDARARISAAASAKVRARMTPSAATPPSVSQA
jgi:hypothetical protein